MDNMSCNDCAALLHVYLDSELDALSAERVAKHLGQCVTCQARFSELAALHKEITQYLTYHRAPTALQRRVVSQIRMQAPSSLRLPKSVLSWGQWLVPVFSLAMVATSSLLYIAAPSAQDQLIDEVVSSHVRSLMEGHVTDVISSDQHTVKPWFTGKIDFSPPVYDFTQQGYPLIGGRLDYLEHQTTAALVYQRNKHIINVFIAPTTEGDSRMHSLSKRGFNIVFWRQNGQTFKAISDINKDELWRFGRLISGSSKPENTNE